MGTEGGGGGGKKGKEAKYPPPSRRAIGQGEGHEAREGREETGQTEDEEGEEEGNRVGETSWEAPVKVTCVGGDATSPEESADLPGFTLEGAHLLLKGVYGDLPHYNNGSHLDGGIMDNTAWQNCWRRLSAYSASWYATPSGAVGRHLTAILAAEWWGVLNRSWNSEIPPVFSHVVLTKTLGVCKA